MRSRCWRSSQKEKVKADLNQKKTNKSSAQSQYRRTYIDIWSSEATTP